MKITKLSSRTLLFGCLFASAAELSTPLVSAAEDPAPTSQGHNEAANSLSAKEKEAGWQLLFDGQSLENFRTYKKDSLSDGWQIEDGAITKAKKGAGDLVTKEEYAAFELMVDYKIGPGGNSGLMYHVNEDNPAPWHSGPEIQIQDNVAGHDPQKSGWLYQLYPAEVDASKPAGEWNTLHIVITPEKCVQYLNGVKYVEYVKGSADWQERVAASKFAQFKDFGKDTSGHIVLQDHGDPVSFRNIKIRPIK